MSESLLENANVTTQRGLLASSSPESAAWLAALSVSTFGNLLDDASLRISVHLRLGARICTEHKCVCGDMVDQRGHHGLSCKKSRERQGCHSALNESIQRALGFAKVTSILEPPSLENVNVITQARLLASSSTGSAAWLAALPASTFGKLLDYALLHILVGLRLNARICAEHKRVRGGISGDVPVKRAEEDRVAIAR